MHLSLLTTFASLYRASWRVWKLSDALMKFPTTLFFLAALASAGVVAQTTSPGTATTLSSPNCPALLAHQFPRLQDEAPQNLCQYAGKVVLVVNTASYCGFTGQYEGLETLYARHKERGLVVLGFPSNDFGQQEPGSSKQIADFCFNTYGVKFPMFSKSVVKGKNKNLLYVELAQATGKEPQWNFHKYLIDRSGKVVANFPGEVAPDSPALVGAIEKSLNQK